MRVGLLAYLLSSESSYRSAGVSTYIRHLLDWLPRVAAQNEYVAFHGPGARLSPGVSTASAPLDTSRALKRILWEQTGLLRQVSTQRIDILHGAVNVVPFMTRMPRVTTVHDLAFLRHPERFPQAKAFYLRMAVTHSARASQRLIAVSASTRNDLVELLGIPARKITVIYPGVDDQFTKLPDREVEQFRASVFAGRPYVLHVGTLEPRKNIDILIRALATSRTTAKLPHVLALVGARGWMYQGLFSLAAELGLAEVVHFIDYVDSAELPLWYNGADVFTYPSAYEGFGLPVVEAMACGVPTITSSSSSLGEIAGDACLVIEPGCVESLSLAITRVVEDTELRQTLSQRGIRRATQFHWRQTAEQTAGVYQEMDVSWPV